MRRYRSKYYVLLFVVYMFVFEFALMGVSSIFGYWDELYAVMAVPLFLFNSNPNFHNKLDNVRIFILLGIYLLVGILSNITSGFATYPAILIDILLNSKFFLGIYTTYYLFKNSSVEGYYPKLKKHIHMIIFILFLLVVIDQILGIFPCNEIRYGIRSEQLFFGHPTGLASVSYFLLLLEVMMYQGKTRDKWILTFGLLVLASTLRSKALGALILFILLYIVIIIKKTRIRLYHFFIAIPSILIVAWNQIYGYFFSSAKLEMARGALFFKSLQILKDFFPLGTGLGTYASAPSADYYSNVYLLYGLNNIHGLSKDYSALVSDVFWPMIIGQTGLIGIIVYIIILVLIIKKIIKLFSIDSRMYLACLGAMGYLFISSTSESSFVNPLSLPLSLIIGIGFIYIDESRNQDKRRYKD